jgi:chemotaxis protein methyltransferase CheR
MADYKEIKSNDFINITDEEFNTLKNFIYTNIGINLTDQKKALVTGRLQKLLRKHSLKTFKEYYELVKNDKTGRELSELANNISTNHTFFGREKDHFDFFYQQTLPEIKLRHERRNDNDIRIWCAGCSTGEESYTILMNMMEYFSPNYGSWNAGLLATDISLRALDIAKKGVYSKDKLEKINPVWVKRYFSDTGTGEYKVKDILRNETTFGRFNLMNEKFPFKKKFDAIFCRNVMIYFDKPTRDKLVNKFYNLLVDGGYLFIGHSETISRDATKFKFIKPALYKKEN